METSTIIQLITAISTAVIAIGSIFVAYFWGYVPRRRQEKIVQLQKELLECYQNIDVFLEIEQEYIKGNGLSKKSVRNGKNLTRKTQPKFVANRINELTKLIQ